MEKSVKRPQTEIRYKFDHDAILNGARVTINDISEEGLFLAGSRPLNIGEKVDIFWSLDGQEASLSGIVVRASAQDGYGVRLVHTAETKRQILGVLARLHLQGKMLKERSTLKEIDVASWLAKLLQGKQTSLS